MSEFEHGPDTHETDKSYENEQSMVSIPLKDYDKLKEQVNNQGKYVTDPGLISVIDKIEELVRALRKHIHRQY
jgi:hypothetical protein|tara:strand:+ start:607 stop:825 length:219 start_codon:yes stop_codon:yes gene_type:complete